MRRSCQRGRRSSATSGSSSLRPQSHDGTQKDYAGHQSRNDQLLKMNCLRKPHQQGDWEQHKCAHYTHYTDVAHCTAVHRTALHYHTTRCDTRGQNDIKVNRVVIWHLKPRGRRIFKNEIVWEPHFASGGPRLNETQAHVQKMGIFACA